MKRSLHRPAASPRRRLAALLALGLAALAPAAVAQHIIPGTLDVTVTGTKKKWHFLTVNCKTNVNASETAASPNNPFLDYRLTVTFTHSSTNKSYLVQGYWAADGNAANTSATTGKYWRAHFTPDEAGQWDYEVSFRKAAGIAVDPSITGTVADPQVDGWFGVFNVAAADPSAPGFLSKGMLRYVDKHYLQFAETGEYFLKSGAGGPENFLGYFEFDNTSFNGGSRSCPPGASDLHEYAPHSGDFNASDPIDNNRTWLGGGSTPLGENILGAVHFLESQGVNSLYFITCTLSDDGDDVWPWVTVGDYTHYDVSKLAQWGLVFGAMSHRGIQLQLFFEEAGNETLLGGTLTQQRKLYYREMVARFGHNHAVQWIIGEETGHSQGTIEDIAEYIRGIDPYEHPIAFHSQFGNIVTQYSPYFGNPDFEASSYQTFSKFYNSVTIGLRSGSEGSTPRRDWVNYGDEQSEPGAVASEFTEARRKGLWGNLMAGGAGVAWYPGTTTDCAHSDTGAEDFSVWSDYFEDTKHAIDFFQTYLPFTEMVPNNALATPACTDPNACASGLDFVFAKVNDTYAVFRGSGVASAATLTLDATNTFTYTVQWYDPRNGGALQSGTVATISGTGPQSIGLPSNNGGSTSNDWVALIKKQ